MGQLETNIKNIRLFTRMAILRLQSPTFESPGVIGYPGMNQRSIAENLGVTPVALSRLATGVATISFPLFLELRSFFIRELGADEWNDLFNRYLDY